jgi:hypothetical protein
MPEKPMMALSGVRSSWLILAMNSDLALEASSASTREALMAMVCFMRVTVWPKLSEYSLMSEPSLNHLGPIVRIFLPLRWPQRIRRKPIICG